MAAQQANPAQELLVRAVRLSQTCGGVVKLACDNTGWQVEIESEEHYLAVVICSWSDRDIVLFDDECQDPERTVCALENAITGHNIIVEELKLVR